MYGNTGRPRRGAARPKSFQIKKRSRQKLCSELRTYEIITLLNDNPQNQVVHNKSTLSIRCSRRVIYTGDVAGATRGWTPIMKKLSLVQKTKRSSALQNTPHLTDHQKTRGKTDHASRNKGSQQVTTKKQRKSKKKREAELLSRWRKRKRCRETRQSLIRDNNRASFSPAKFVIAIKTSELNTLTDRSIDE
jgi:hypothetical protein